jgi:hypothetical protein
MRMQHSTSIVAGLSLIASSVATAAMSDGSVNTIDVQLSTCIRAVPEIGAQIRRTVATLPKPTMPPGYEHHVKDRLRSDFQQEPSELIEGIKVPRIAEPSLPSQPPKFEWAVSGREPLLCKSSSGGTVIVLAVPERASQHLQSGQMVKGTRLTFLGVPPRPVILEHE